MNCDAFFKQMSEYLDDDLSEGKRLAMDRHADECGRCNALIEDIRKLTERLSQLPRLEPSAGFQFALRSHLLMEEARSGRISQRVRKVLFPSAQRTVLSAAAVIILGLGLASVLDEHDGISQQARDTGIEVSVQSPVLSMDHRSALKQVPDEGAYRLSSRYLSEQVQSDSTKQVQPDPIRPDDGVRKVTVSF